MVGVLPTRTSVEIRTDAGVASIPAADPRAAGVMTAQQAATLADLEQWRVRIDAGSTINIVGAAPADLSRYALKSDIAQIANRLAQDAAIRSVTAPISTDTSDLGETVRATAEAVVHACDETRSLALKQAELEARMNYIEETLRGLGAMIGKMTVSEAA